MRIFDRLRRQPAPTAEPIVADDLPFVRKHEAACCVSRRDEEGRLPIGYCSPGCERRPVAP